MMIRVWLGLALVLGTPRAAAAQQSAPSPDDEARTVFELGRRAFEDGRFEDAIDYYARAFELSGRPELAFNLGVAHERAGRSRDAVRWFERYLADRPDADNRGEVEERLRVLRRRVLDDEPPPTSGPSAGSVVLGGAGLLVAGAGVALLVLANGAASDVEDAAQRGDAYWVDVEDDASRADTFSLLGGVLLGVGGAALAGGLVWLLISDTPEATVAVGPSGARLEGRF